MYSETVLATNLQVFKSTFAQNQKKQDIKTNQNNANHNTIDLSPRIKHKAYNIDFTTKFLAEFSLITNIRHYDGIISN